MTTQLHSLTALRLQRQQRYQEAKAATAPTLAPMTLMDRLQHLDAVVGVLESLQPIDARPLAQALLASLLRLSWARTSGKPHTCPEAAEIPLKLFNRKAIDKPTLTRLRSLTAPEASVRDVIAGCRDLMVWLAMDRGAVLA
ncbi:hypothetical protein Mal15_38050 [Stieleria maiorica]|uniref:Uncharacterized protein n=1 Tax=Stieleria maiorica TaxID=2795974 RepID=A0A5B9MGV9_9BACT|nr:hypothetical protein [Stieleria maiorica]QEF99739.1 hypothetical protein Mal15_38050 [Stieleria maiorica]